MLTFDNVRFQYAVENFSIIDHLSFEVQDGEFVSIIGASGCGKSTIFRLVNKLLTPASAAQTAAEDNTDSSASGV